MLSKTSQWHITMPVAGGINDINKATWSVRRPKRALETVTGQGGRHFVGVWELSIAYVTAIFSLYHSQ
jgi:hypothetical protein